MGKKKMKLPFLLKNREVKPSWPWPSCHQPRTLSFRTINSEYLDATMDVFESTPESFFTNSDSPSFSTASEESGGGAGDPMETVIQGLRSDRLFFKPEETSSILETKAGDLAFKESVQVLSMESQNPYVDFRKSMEEMVEAHDVKDWECLEELLCWYLRVNGKCNHKYIVGAFVDLMVGLSVDSSCSSSCHLSFYTCSTSSSFLSSPCLEAGDEVDTPSSSTELEGKNER
ncbi:transcription repressor OFP13-like [Quillaja saponaria]|uniref:Transcription repressor n=1 Tax=Quillaja saponaria TaxID=32244 RepID=A0AAD7VDG6_QUISA|nr:transcription repressor OFP13-like [Quillaja saponaria]